MVAVLERLVVGLTLCAGAPSESTSKNSNTVSLVSLKPLLNVDQDPKQKVEKASQHHKYHTCLFTPSQYTPTRSFAFTSVFVRPGFVRSFRFVTFVLIFLL